ncbi:MAG: hypothetical protein JSV04_08530 [Candidatus Heimdallarchaeota archaeon]|nr:MAG: hypothetical protein JSV04_08530 [Candidatus Heimdallarchaeota archaeon]
MAPKLQKIRFQIPSSRNHFCEMQKTEGGYQLTFFDVGKKLKTVNITEDQIDREYLRKLSVKAGVNFYALTGPYDCSDEILRQWHKHFKKKGFFGRLFGK